LNQHLADGRAAIASFDDGLLDGLAIGEAQIDETSPSRRRSRPEARMPALPGIAVP
jgi:hypothetical protein